MPGIFGEEDFMYLIVGLGNPGIRYAATRHNIGFDVITWICDNYDISLDIKKHKALCGKGCLGGEKILLAQPQTYMNLSGESVRELVEYYKVDPGKELIVVYDDISLVPGQLRIRPKGSAGGHNGIKNIIQCLKTDVFPRVKVGVGEKPQGWDLADHVLSRFPEEENALIRKILPVAGKACEIIIREGCEAAMNQLNGYRAE